MNRKLLHNADIVKYLEEDAEMRDRFISWAFEQDEKITTLPEFISALNKAFNTEWGQRVLDKLGEDEYKLLWESSELNSRADFIKNRKDKGLPEDTDDEAEEKYEIGRKVNLDTYTKPRDVYIIPIQKNIQIKSYKRNGLKISDYKKSYTKWTPAQKEFLYQYKVDKVSRKDAIKSFQIHFKNSGKTSSSIGTKYYRL